MVERVGGAEEGLCVFDDEGAAVGGEGDCVHFFGKCCFRGWREMQVTEGGVLEDL